MNISEIKIKNNLNLATPRIINEINSSLNNLESAVFDLEQKTDLGESNSIPGYINELDPLFKKLNRQVEYLEFDDQIYNNLIKRYEDLKDKYENLIFLEDKGED